MQQAAVLVRRAWSRVAQDARRATARLHELHRLIGSSASTAPLSRADAPRRRQQASGGRVIRLLRRARRSPIFDITADRRGAPILVLTLLVLASLVALPQGGTAIGASPPTPSVAAARIAALSGGPATGNTQPAASDERAFQPFDVGTAGTQGLGGDAGSVDAQSAGSYAPDGTLLKPVAVDVVLGGIDDQVRTYTVRSGDTLRKIAAKFGLKTTSMFWANKLGNQDTLHVGEVLSIPPTDGVLYIVKEGDTVESIAAAFHADVASVVAYNSLGGDVVVIGETIMVPDGRGAAMPTGAASAAAKPATRSAALGACRTCSYKGAMTWPVDGWYFISQYYHYGHLAIDIAGHYGTPIVAAVSGKVVETGWLGSLGYTIWISNGNGMYETYNHLSYIGVTVGQYVSRGTRIGRMGMSGNATGPHLHFEVWIGLPYRGTAVNPLRYF